MRLATLDVHGRSIVALVDPDAGRYWPVEDLITPWSGDMLRLIEDFDAIRSRLVRKGEGRPISETRVAAPLCPPRNIMCVGKNYRDHAEEFAKSGFDSSAASAAEAVPQAPIIFTKTPQTVIADGEDIPYPKDVSDCIDYEAELAVIIGRPGRGIPRGQAMDHVFGYTILNDVTARDLQARHKQWFLGKSLDGFCPMGPWLTTADEVDASDLQLQCWVNGELRQRARTRDLIFDIPTLIETLSAGMTLRAGDIIATGTPAGVGVGFSPPRYLRPGDEVVIEIEGLGRLTNRLGTD